MVATIQNRGYRTAYPRDYIALGIVVQLLPYLNHIFAVSIQIKHSQHLWHNKWRTEIPVEAESYNQIKDTKLLEVGTQN